MGTGLTKRGEDAPPEPLTSLQPACLKDDSRSSRKNKPCSQIRSRKAENVSLTNTSLPPCSSMQGSTKSGRAGANGMSFPKQIGSCKTVACVGTSFLMSQGAILAMAFAKSQVASDVSLKMEGHGFLPKVSLREASAMF